VTLSQSKLPLAPWRTSFSPSILNQTMPSPRKVIPPGNRGSEELEVLSTMLYTIKLVAKIMKKLLQE
jgi:hypothetical protein